MSGTLLGAIERHRQAVSYGLWAVGSALVLSIYAGAPDALFVVGIGALVLMGLVTTGFLP